MDDSMKVRTFLLTNRLTNKQIYQRHIYELANRVEGGKVF